MKKIALYPGTFDPITYGHVDVIKRARKLFDEIIVAIAANPTKNPLFDLDKRIALSLTALQGIEGVRVMGFSNLLTHFAEEQGAHCILRGLRAVTDFDYEFQLAGMNRQLAPTLETIFLTPSSEYAYLSSSLVKEIARHHGTVEQFVPQAVESALKQAF